MVQKAPPRPRGRPRAYDPDVALAQAMEAFWISGYAATSLDDLSAATGMNRPSLYAAFGDKEALYLKALARYRERSRTRLREILDADVSLRECLLTLLGRILDVYSASGGRGCFSVSTAVTEAATNPVVRAQLQAGIQELDQIFAARVRRARDRGEVPARADPAVLGTLVTATIHTLALRARAGEPRAALDRIVKWAVDLICRSP
jgi:TetR/AcrR family transcriptional regulator, copper-responsive repressor